MKEIGKEEKVPTVINANLGRIAISIEGTGAFDAASGLGILKELSTKRVKRAPVHWTHSSGKAPKDN